MKSDWKPFTKPTKNTETTQRLDTAERKFRDLGGIPEGETFAGFARGFQVSPEALRKRLLKAGLMERNTKPADPRKSELCTKRIETPPVMPNAHRSEPEKGVTGCNMDPVLAPLIVENPVSEPENKNPPAVQAPSRKEIAVLSETEIDQHDAEIAELARESVAAFRAGKSKGPKGKRVLPVTKVSDVTALDTLFRRATRQGEREGKGTGGNLISIQFLGGVSRESVRVARDETSPVLDTQGEEVDLPPR